MNDLENELRMLKSPKLKYDYYGSRFLRTARSRRRSASIDQNFSDNITLQIANAVSGGVAPHQISGQLGYGSASSGFINMTMYGDASAFQGD